MDESHQDLSNSEVHEIEMPDMSGPSSQHEGTGTDQNKTMLHKRKASLKRKATLLKDEKTKKKTKRKRKIQRIQRPNYTVQHGEDMLLIISNVSGFDSVRKPQRKGCKKKKAKTKTTAVKRKKEATQPRVSKVTKEVLGYAGDLEEPDTALSYDWGERMPEEVLVKIFKMVVHQDGAIPFLCRVGRVCRLWNSAASSPALWHSVSIGYCWIEPGKSQLPGTEQKIKNTVNWLTQNRFSQLRNFKLCHWKKHVDFVVQTFRLMNINPVPKMIRNTPSSTLGFPMLEELCIASSSHSFMNDQNLLNILHGSPHLRVLDLRGCSRITAAGLRALPCEGLECLFWGLYFNSKVMVASNKGIHMLAQKWSHSLRELDLTNQPFSEEDMEIAIGHLANGTGADFLHSVNLSGTKITTYAVRLLVGHSTALNYLNLSSCRYLPRGLKRVYRGQEDIHQLLDKLNECDV
ncbi:F-box/LRR-repeat protein 6 [Bagarius yarrelli]|uniref:F-box/LRR-repeat protein 6 n=1 Tax=Bagarius yarrelli TaxID=175774 RepID=A0A556TPU6_BAGYA|nr:F-box/LRR-repeat protein 6 [Bagarius yarrelli]